MEFMLRFQHSKRINYNVQLDYGSVGVACDADGLLLTFHINGCNILAVLGMLRHSCFFLLGGALCKKKAKHPNTINLISCMASPTMTSENRKVR